MTVFPIIILLSLNMGNSGGAMLPRVILNPNYENILIGDSVTLTCIVDPDDGNPTYQWYKNQQLIPELYQQSLEIWYSKEGDSGDYQCRSVSQNKSDTVTLKVTYKTVILQGPPPPIYEGDPVTLRCHHRKDYDGRNARFYKDGAEIPSSGSELRIPAADKNTRGTYTCRKEVIFPLATDYTDYPSEAVSISVKKLFTKPIIRVTPERIIKGEEMAVTCDTKLDPLRPDTQLQIAFYRDGHTVQEFTLGDIYRVLTAQTHDSGDYSCEVRTVSRTPIRKRSDAYHIQILPENNPDPTHQPGRDSTTATTIKRSGLTTKRAAVTTTTPTGRESGPAASLKDKPELIAAISVAIIGILVIIIVSAILIWRRKTRRKPVPVAQQPEKTEAEVNDPESQDVCYTYLDVGQLKKGSRKKQNDEPEVTYATVKKSEDN